MCRSVDSGSRSAGARLPGGRDCPGPDGCRCPPDSGGPRAMGAVAPMRLSPPRFLAAQRAPVPHPPLGVPQVESIDEGGGGRWSAIALTGQRCRWPPDGPSRCCGNARHPHVPTRAADARRAHVRGETANSTWRPGSESARSSRQEWARVCLMSWRNR